MRVVVGWKDLGDINVFVMSTGWLFVVGIGMEDGMDMVYGYAYGWHGSWYLNLFDESKWTGLLFMNYWELDMDDDVS